MKCLIDKFLASALVCPSRWCSWTNLIPCSCPDEQYHFYLPNSSSSLLSEQDNSTTEQMGISGEYIKLSAKLGSGVRLVSDTPELDKTPSKSNRENHISLPAACLSHISGSSSLSIKDVKQQTSTAIGTYGLILSWIFSFSFLKHLVRFFERGNKPPHSI